MGNTDHAGDTNVSLSEHDFPTFLQQSAAFDTDLFRCYMDQAEKSR